MTSPREQVALITSITAHATGDNDDQVLAEVQLVLDGATITDLTDLRRLRS